MLHLTAVPFLNFPAGHDLQTLPPPVGKNLPLGQAPQRADAGSAAKPGAHSTHAELAGANENLPAGHRAQNVLP